MMQPQILGVPREAEFGNPLRFISDGQNEIITLTAGVCMKSYVARDLAF